MQSWPAPAVPALPGTGPQLRLYDSADRQVRPVTAGRDRHHVRLRHHAVRRHPPRPRRHLPDVRPGAPAVAGLRPRVHYVQNVTDVDDPLFERADRDGIDWRELGDRETAAVPRGHGGAAGAAAARLRRRHRGHRRGRSSWSRRCSPPARPTSSTTPSTPTSTSAPTPPRSSATSRATTATPCCGCSPSAAATPTGAGKGDAARRAAVARGAARRAQLAVAVRSGPAGLARRVRGDRARAASAPASTSRAAAAT